MEWINRYVLGTAVPWLLMVCGLFFLIRLRFFYLRHPIATARLLLGRNREERRASFRSLSLALAGTLGVGNIVGVAGAIVMGGAGAIFWMWVSAFFAMALKYAEILLAMRYRHYDEEGRPHGSAMDYIRAGFRKRGLPVLGGFLASVFALLCLGNALSMGSLLQVSAVASALEGAFEIPRLLTGIVLALVALWLIRGGSEGMMRITEKMVPLMTLGYLILSAAVLILRSEAIPRAFFRIFEDAFSPVAAAGGVGGFLLSRGVRFGTMRGLISNEAGCGTAPAAHATAIGVSPVRQGIMGIFEVFADTVVLCTLTALVILVGVGETGAVGEDFMGITLGAYRAVLGQPAAYFMAAAVLFFGFATVICWAHYGMESVSFLTEARWAKRGFGVIYGGSVLAGAVVSAAPIWQITDLAVGGMTLINLLTLMMMNREVREETMEWVKDAFLEPFEKGSNPPIKM